MINLIKVLCTFKPIITNSVVRFITGFPLIIGVQEIGEYYQNLGFVLTSKTLATLTFFLFYYFIFLAVLDGMSGRIYTFHETRNSANLNKNPLKFAIKHRNKIVMLYKLLFIAGSIYALIMLWFFD
ncbi:uncharacterized membrane protein YjjP (DUF1212 family) [Buttiauxella sp. BIGb0471]|nr:uncharacterized membrane protein YjjP (DUF1212 family) [Buttiauxella sp. BIGb0471]